MKILFNKFIPTFIIALFIPMVLHAAVISAGAGGASLQNQRTPINRDHSTSVIGPSKNGGATGGSRDGGFKYHLGTEVNVYTYDYSERFPFDDLRNASWGNWRKCSKVRDANSAIRGFVFWEISEDKLHSAKISCRTIEENGSFGNDYTLSDDLFTPRGDEGTMYNAQSGPSLTDLPVGLRFWEDKMQLLYIDSAGLLDLTANRISVIDEYGEQQKIVEGAHLDGDEIKYGESVGTQDSGYNNTDHESGTWTYDEGVVCSQHDGNAYVLTGLRLKTINSPVSDDGVVIVGVAYECTNIVRE